MAKARRTRATGGGGLRVLVTGGTGFVGFHTAKVLHEAGHEVRLLVRSPDKMRRVLGPFGLDTLDHVQGDIADEKSVARALEGCDAVVHAAANVNIHASDALETIRTNRRGTELVIGGAVERGIGRIVQVSSSTAMFNPGLKVVDENSPLGTQGVGYGRSKIESDLYVRGLQQHGAPVYTTYPGSIIGPDDPGMSEAMAGLRSTVDDFCIVTSGGIQIVDVRDLALAHLKLIERGGPPARYMMGGQYYEWREFNDMLDALVGAKLKRLRLPRTAMQLLGRVGDIVHRFRPFEMPITYEAIWYATEWTPSDDSLVKKELGINYRDTRETLADAIVWLASKGHLKHPEYADHIRRERARKGGSPAKKAPAKRARG
jgi:nucleoside-diphosphate-sugar epimerase